ncbi:MAG TPA: PAS domain S-box protein, partial [Candidatus Eisenbacteria bacterium]|nr:PAS domain S-box protein [Candidatus Eisenbacteria bacterium]
MRWIHDYIWIAALYTVFIVCVALWPQAAWVLIPAGIGTAVFTHWKRGKLRGKRIENIQKRLSNLKSEGLFLDENIGDTGDDVFYRMIITLLTDLERTMFKLVEKNIQLLSLKEIGRNIISSLDEKKLVDSVFDYLVHGVGYREAAFIILRRRKQCFQAIVSIERNTRIVRRVVNFGLDDLDGAIRNALATGKAFLIKDVRMHPLIDVDGEPLFPDSTMTSYICVPLMKSSGIGECCKSETCILRQTGDCDDESGIPASYLTRDECLACPDLPLLGALLVTDGYRATSLTNIDQVTVETVGSLVGSNMENWMLYQELRQEERFREKVFEGMMHGLIVSDMQGNVTFANRSAREMSGLDAKELLAKNIDELICDDDSGKTRNGSPVFKALDSGDAMAFHEAYLMCSPDSFIPVRMNVSKLLGDDNDTQGAIVLFADLSEIKSMEEEIRHLDNLAVLGRFTSAVAHEIRNPLTGIAAGIQYLDRSAQLDEEHKENITHILAEVARLNRIITDLFKVAKPRDLLYAESDPAVIIEKSVKSISDILDSRKVVFSSSVAPGVPKIEVDPDQITQVLINLIKNAAEAVDEGGEVSVTVKPFSSLDPEMRRQKGKDIVVIDVADNGPGIDSTDRQRIFLPFFSRKKAGTGLGLFVTHSIVQHHQGSIKVIS